MRPHSVGCVPTYSAGRLLIAVRPAAGHGNQEVFETYGMLCDKAELQETTVAGATPRPVDDAVTLDVMLQQLGIGHERLRFACLQRPIFCDLVW